MEVITENIKEKINYFELDPKKEESIADKELYMGAFLIGFEQFLKNSLKFDKWNWTKILLLFWLLSKFKYFLLFNSLLILVQFIQLSSFKESVILI